MKWKTKIAGIVNEKKIDCLTKSTWDIRESVIEIEIHPRWREIILIVIVKQEARRTRRWLMKIHYRWAKIERKREMMSNRSMFSLNGLVISSSTDQQNSIYSCNSSHLVWSRELILVRCRMKWTRSSLVRWETSGKFSSQSLLSIHRDRFLDFWISIPSMVDHLCPHSHSNRSLFSGDLLLLADLLEWILDLQFERVLVHFHWIRNIVSHFAFNRKLPTDPNCSVSIGFSCFNLCEQSSQTTVFHRSCLYLFTSNWIVQNSSLSFGLHHRRSRFCSNQWLFFLQISIETNRQTFSSKFISQLFRNGWMDGHISEISSIEILHRRSMTFVQWFSPSLSTRPLQRNQRRNLPNFPFWSKV